MAEFAGGSSAGTDIGGAGSVAAAGHGPARRHRHQGRQRLQIRPGQIPRADTTAALAAAVLAVAAAVALAVVARVAVSLALGSAATCGPETALQLPGLRRLH